MAARGRLEGIRWLQMGERALSPPETFSVAVDETPAWLQSAAAMLDDEDTKAEPTDDDDSSAPVGKAEGKADGTTTPPDQMIGAADEASLGFWALAHDADGATGLSGYGGLADCRLAATWQYFGPPGAPPACATRCLGAALCSVCRRRGARHADGRGGRQRQSGHACARRG